MALISELLAKSAEELRSYQASAVGTAPDSAWLSRMANRLAAASLLPPDRIEREVQAIAHAFVDCGPLDEQATPSFWLVADGLQRKMGRK